MQKIGGRGFIIHVISTLLSQPINSYRFEISKERNVGVISRIRESDTEVRPQTETSVEMFGVDGVDDELSVRVRGWLGALGRCLIRLFRAMN